MKLFATILCCLIATAAFGAPIHEAMYVPIGGIDQWITIDGQDRRNPVVLFLHGGPGDAYSPFAAAMFKGRDKDFTLVQWDQRGAGRTFRKNGTSIEPTMTIERMVADGVEVAEYLTKHLHKKKITLVGGSWGSILGIHLAHSRPELFDAYVGVAQMVNWQQNVAASYARILELSRDDHDEAAVSELTALGPPPWTSLRQWPLFRKWQRTYQAKRATATPPDKTISPEYDSPAERATYAEADDFSFLHFVGMEMSGPLTKVDLPALGTRFSIPVFMIFGKEDLVALPELANEYFDSIEAPMKRFYVVPKTGHEPSADLIALLFKVIRPSPSR